MSRVVLVGEKVLVSKLIVADTFWLRLKGLLGKKGLESEEGLLLKPCNQIHTWFMAFTLDVLYLDKAGLILELTNGLPPGKAGPRVKGCFQVLELKAGTIGKYDLRKGNILSVHER